MEEPCNLQSMGSQSWTRLSDFTFTNMGKKLLLLKKKKHYRTSLVVQWLGMYLSMQRTQVQFLVQEDPTCHGVISPWTTTTKAHAPYSLCSTRRETTSMRSPRITTRQPLLTANREGPCAMKTQHSQN